MKRVATVQIGQIEATFDGDQFRCQDRATARMLNRLLDYGRAGAMVWTSSDYRPDLVNNVAQDIAEACGGSLIRPAPEDKREYPSDAIF